MHGWWRSRTSRDGLVSLAWALPSARFSEAQEKRVPDTFPELFVGHVTKAIGDEMAKRIDLEQILKKHPEVDVAQLQRALDLIDELRKGGLVHPQGYRSSSPSLIRRRARLMDDLVDDPRAVRLRPR